MACDGHPIGVSTSEPSPEKKWLKFTDAAEVQDWVGPEAQRSILDATRRQASSDCAIWAVVYSVKVFSDIADLSNFSLRTPSAPSSLPSQKPEKKRKK